jgi:hypothetical protein
MWRRQTIRAPPQPNRMKLPAWRPAVALALVSLDAGAPKRNADRQKPSLKQALGAASGPGANADRRQRNPPHS